MKPHVEALESRDCPGADLLAGVNGLRILLRRRLLVPSAQLMVMAQVFAQRMAEADHYLDAETGHLWRGTTFFGRAAEVGFRWSALGEDVGEVWGYADPAAELPARWAASPGHLAVLSDKLYTLVGVGLAVSASGVTYGVIELGRP